MLESGVQVDLAGDRVDQHGRTQGAVLEHGQQGCVPVETLPLGLPHLTDDHSGQRVVRIEDTIDDAGPRVLAHSGQGVVRVEPSIDEVGPGVLMVHDRGGEPCSFGLHMFFQLRQHHSAQCGGPAGKSDVGSPMQVAGGQQGEGRAVVRRLGLHEAGQGDEQVGVEFVQLRLHIDDPVRRCDDREDGQIPHDDLIEIARFDQFSRVDHLLAGRPRTGNPFLDGTIQARIVPGMDIEQDFDLLAQRLGLLAALGQDRG